MPTETQNPTEETPEQPEDEQEDEDSRANAGEAAESEGFDNSEEAQDFTGEAEEALDNLPEWATRQIDDLEGDEQPEQAQGPAAQEPPSEPASELGGPDLQEYKEAAPNLDLMLDLPLDVTVELGRAELALAQVLELKTGSVVQLDRLPGEPLDLYVNDQLVARGEIIVLNETFAFRITDLIEGGKQRHP